MTQKSKQLKILERKSKIRASDYNRVFSTEQGKRVLFDLLENSHYLSSSFVDGDPHKTAFHEGERNIVGKILTRIHTTPEKLDELFREREKFNDRTSLSTDY